MDTYEVRLQCLKLAMPFSGTASTAHLSHPGTEQVLETARAYAGFVLERNVPKPESEVEPQETAVAA